MKDGNDLERTEVPRPRKKQSPSHWFLPQLSFPVVKQQKVAVATYQRVLVARLSYYIHLFLFRFAATSSEGTVSVRHAPATSSLFVREKHDIDLAPPAILPSATTCVGVRTVGITGVFMIRCRPGIWMHRVSPLVYGHLGLSFAAHREMRWPLKEKILTR